MRKDPTEFRERFARWKQGLPAYENGKAVWYDQDKDLYYGGSLPEVTVTGEKRNHSAIDYLLWKADRAGAPSHVTNAVRDFNNRIQNFPVIAADATARYIKGGYDNILQAYKAADVNPSKSLRKFLVYPYTNDENNYSKEELASMRELSDMSGKGTGNISYKSYRQKNNGRYAGDIGFSDFNKPNKVVEWSLGQTERKNGSEPYLYDNFSYDTKDTKGVYLKGMLKGNVNPVMGLRSIFGLIGSKGYDDGTNSATSIKTRIPTRYLRK